MHDFPQKWSLDTGYHLAGIIAAPHHNGTSLLILTGVQFVDGKRESALLAVSASGSIIWSSEIKHSSENRNICVYPNIVEAPGIGTCVFYSTGSTNIQKPGTAHLARVSDGQIIWEIPTRSQHAGNGSCIVTDIDNDDRQEILWWDSANVFCCDLATGTVKWVYNDRIQICHGRPGLSDVNGDGIEELIVGTEYSCDDNTSSILALNGNGEAVWRSDGFADDLGSTPVIVADVNNDGAEEFLITGLDLEGRKNEEWSSLWCFDYKGQLLYRTPCGCGGFAVTRSANGELCGAGITSKRDGGTSQVKEARCFRLSDGSMIWSRSLDRVHLDAQNPVSADVTGDGIADFILATGNPSGYGNYDTCEPYSDVHIFDQAGNVVCKMTYPDYVHQLMAGDIDNDGRNELLIPGADGILRCYATPGIASRPWGMTGGGPKRLYGSF